MSAAYLDTHICVFLHDGMVEEFSQAAAREIEASELLISPMVLLELEYLHKRARIGIPGKVLYETIHTDFGVTMCRIPFAKVVDESMRIDWTEDPFDRLIVAQAKANHASRLITRDRLIRAHYPKSVW